MSAKEIRAAAERLRAVVDEAASALRPVPETIPDGHPHAELIAGLRELADWLAVHPEMPGFKANAGGHLFEWRDTGYDEHASVDKVIRAGEVLGVPAASHVDGKGCRHWTTGRKFGSVDARFFFMTEPSFADYRAPEGGDSRG